MKVDDQGLHVKMPDGDIQIHAVDAIVVCAGWCSATSPTGLSIPTWWWSVGRKTPRLDAQRAIREGLDYLPCSMPKQQIGLLPGWPPVVRVEQGGAKPNNHGLVGFLESPRRWGQVAVGA